MDDRTMLELAAKAAGYEYARHGGYIVVDGIPGNWNPLTDDGDALRLAVSLGISITPYPIYAEDARHSVLAKQRRRSDTLRETNPTEVIELYRDDPCAATRRAITRAAAEIQLAKESGNENSYVHGFISRYRSS
jgi:hypothetical protein